MSTRFRLGIIVIAVTISALLVWPNIGERDVSVYFLSDLTEEQRNESMQELEKFLEKNYKEQYTWQKKEKVLKPKDDDKPQGLNFVPAGGGERKVTYYQVTGSFIQAAFLNELGRIKGVDGEKTAVEPLWVERKLKAKPFKLGLDLQGGMNLVLEGDFVKFISELERIYPPSYIEDLDKKIAAEKDPTKKENLQFEKQQIAESKNLTDEKKREYMVQAKEIIRSRIDSLGASEAIAVYAVATIIKKD